MAQKGEFKNLHICGEYDNSTVQWSRSSCDDDDDDDALALVMVTMF